MKVSFEIGIRPEAEATKLFQRVCLQVGTVFKEHLGRHLPTFDSLISLYKAEGEETDIVDLWYLSAGLERFMQARLKGWRKADREITWQIVLQSEDAIAVGPDAKLKFTILEADQLTEIFEQIGEVLSTKYPDYEIQYLNEHTKTYVLYRHGERVAQPSKPTKGKS
jgi:hypothetical protein